MSALLEPGCPMICAESLRVLVTEGHLTLDQDRLLDLCRRWRVSQLSIFGSALRDDFREESDLDFLVSFESNAPWDLLQLGDMQDELEGWLGRSVDLVELEGLRNPIRRQRILDTRRVLYDSRQG